MNEASPLYHALIGGITGGFIGIIMAIPAIIRYFKKRRYENDLSAFHQNADGGYTCPVCGMTNDRMDRCERCYYIPPALRNVEVRPRSSTPPAVPARVKDTPPPAPVAPVKDTPARPTQPTHTAPKAQNDFSRRESVDYSFTPPKRSASVDFAVRHGTIGLLSRRVALYYNAVKYHKYSKEISEQFDREFFTEQSLAMSVYLDMATYLSARMERADTYAAAYSVYLAKHGKVQISGFPFVHSSNAFSEAELVCNVALQTLITKFYIDNNRDPDEIVDAVLHFKPQIFEIVRETLYQGPHGKEYNAVKKSVAFHLDEIDFWSIFFVYTHLDCPIEENEKTQFYSLVCE